MFENDDVDNAAIGVSGDTIEPEDTGSAKDDSYAEQSAENASEGGTGGNSRPADGDPV